MISKTLIFSRNALWEKGQPKNKMEPTNSLDEALKNVNLLDDLALSDEQPVIEAPAASITYNPNFDTNFEDNEAFITCNSKYLEEAAMHRGLVSSSYFDIRKISDHLLLHFFFASFCVNFAAFWQYVLLTVHQYIL